MNGPDVVDLVDPMQERAIFRMVVDLVAVGRYWPLSQLADDALRCIGALAAEVLVGIDDGVG